MCPEYFDQNILKNHIFLINSVLLGMLKVSSVIRGKTLLHNFYYHVVEIMGLKHFFYMCVYHNHVENK